MRVFITGGGGFLGKALRRALADRGDHVDAPSSTECNLLVSDSLAPWSHQAYDRVFHLAAWTQAGDFCLHHPGEQWLINQQMNTRVLSWWQQSQPQAKLICIGTSCSYDPTLPLVESNYLIGVPIASLYTYAATKRMLLIGCLALRQQFGLEYLHVVPSTLYGESYHTDGRQMHFIFDLIRKIVRGKLLGETAVLWGDGTQRRELIYVNDFVASLLALDAAGIANETVNIGAGREHSIREFAGMICELVGYDASQIQYDTSRYSGAKSKCLDVGKIDALLPTRVRTPLREGLERTVAWFWDHRDQLIGSA